MSVQLDATDDSIDLTTAAALFPRNSAATFSFWLWPTIDVVGGGDPRILVKDTSHAISITATKALAFEVDNAIDALYVQTANSVVTFSTWQHVLVTWDGSNTAANVHIYVNGTETTYASQLSGSNTAIDNSASTAILGNVVSGGTRPLGGRLHGFAVYNVVLSAPNIAKLANSGNIRGTVGIPLTISGLQIYLPLDDYTDGSSNTGRTYRDKSGAGIDGTGNWGANASGMTSRVEQGYLEGGINVWGS